MRLGQVRLNQDMSGKVMRGQNGLEKVKIGGVRIVKFYLILM